MTSATYFGHDGIEYLDPHYDHDGDRPVYGFEMPRKGAAPLRCYVALDLDDLAPLEGQAVGEKPCTVCGNPRLTLVSDSGAAPWNYSAQCTPPEGARWSALEACGALYPVRRMAAKRLDH